MEACGQRPAYTSPSPCPCPRTTRCDPGTPSARCGSPLGRWRRRIPTRPISKPCISGLVEASRECHSESMKARFETGTSPRLPKGGPVGPCSAGDREERAIGRTNDGRTRTPRLLGGSRPSCDTCSRSGYSTGATTGSRWHRRRSTGSCGRASSTATGPTIWPRNGGFSRASWPGRQRRLPFAAAVESREAAARADCRA
jgi:hypothetical protein